jgi:intracellular sulfur oxidation DsrE/DsrF family protein
MSKRIKQIAALVFLPLLMVSTVFAEHQSLHKLIIQVSSDDVNTHKLALNNAVNLQKIYGMDEMVIEIVAYGPGLELLTEESEVASRVESLAAHDIRFSACQNTMNAIKQKTGKEPVLLDGVETVNAGVARIMELQEQGYAYIRP